MYKNKTFENILSDSLKNVPNDVNKRQGSVIYDAIAPFSAEMSKFYIELENLIKLMFLETTYEEFLDLKAYEYGLTRYKSTKALRKASFYSNDNVLIDASIGSRYNIQNLTYVVTEKISTGVFKVECEIEGAVGNQYFGNLYPVAPNNKLKKAVLEEVIKIGADDEDDEDFRKRIVEYVTYKPFGGNRADYKRILAEYGGVGGFKIARTGRGRIDIFVIDDKYEIPNSQFLNNLQNYIDPFSNRMEGIGQAPIDHYVSVNPARGHDIIVDLQLTLLEGYSITMLKSEIDKTIKEYIDSVIENEYVDLGNPVVIKTAFIDYNILQIDGIEDVGTTKINGSSTNYVCSNEGIPVLRVVNARTL